MRKTIASAVMALCGAAGANAEVVDFDQNGGPFQTNSFTSGSLRFDSEDFFNTLGVWTTPPDHGAYNGTHYLLDGLGDTFTMQRIDHSSFLLGSFQMALGMYETAPSKTITATYFLQGGGQSVVTYDLVDAFQTFTPDIRVSKVAFDLANLPDSYISMDNITLAPVPEPAVPALVLAGLGVLGLARRVARPERDQPLGTWRGLPSRSIAT